MGLWMSWYCYVAASMNLAAGLTPYVADYWYSPLFAIGFLPFALAGLLWVWESVVIAGTMLALWEIRNLPWAIRVIIAVMAVWWILSANADFLMVLGTAYVWKRVQSGKLAARDGLIIGLCCYNPPISGFYCRCGHFYPQLTRKYVYLSLPL